MSNFYIENTTYNLLPERDITDYADMFALLKIILNGKILYLQFIILLVFSSGLMAQIIISDPDALLQKASRDSMYFSAANVLSGKRNAHVDFQYCNIIHNNEVWHLIPDGHFDVFVWEDGNWENTYRKDDLGYNFYSPKFIYDNKIHSYGGYGFWRLHSDIISYDTFLREWVKSDKYENVPAGVGLPVSDALVIISGNELSVLDLKSGEVNTCTVDIFSQFQLSDPDFKLVGKNFTVFLEENLQLLIEKPSNQIFKLKKGRLDKVHQISKYDCIHIKGDSIIAVSPDLDVILKEVLHADFDQYTSVECLSEKPLISYWLYLGIILLGMGIALGTKKYFAIKSVKNVEHSAISEAHKNMSPFEKIRNVTGKTLTQDELDILFEIPADSTPETKRFKRAQLISEVNSKSMLLLSKEFIIRIKDPQDKRKYLYYVEL